MTPSFSILQLVLEVSQRKPRPHKTNGTTYGQNFIPEAKRQLSIVQLALNLPRYDMVAHYRQKLQRFYWELMNHPSSSRRRDIMPEIGWIRRNYPFLYHEEEERLRSVGVMPENIYGY